MADSAYYQRNRERLLAAAKRRYLAKTDEVRAYKKLWQAKNRKRIAVQKAAKYLESREVIRAKYKAIYHSDPATRHNRIESARRYRREHPERAKAAVYAWCKENRERLREIKRAYAKAHPEIARSSQANRRARLAGAYRERISFRKVLEKSNGLCGICGDVLDLSAVHFDHIVPLARGGSHTNANLQATHPRCNLVKGDRLQEVA